MEAVIDLVQTLVGSLFAFALVAAVVERMAERWFG